MRKRRICQVSYLIRKCTLIGISNQSYQFQVLRVSQRANSERGDSGSGSPGSENPPEGGLAKNRHLDGWTHEWHSIELERIQTDWSMLTIVQG